MTLATTPECGIFPGMSWAEYAAIPLPSASVIEWARIDLLHLKAAMEGRLEREDTDAMAFGRALHLRLLEPDIYPQRVLIAEPCCAIIQSGKRKGQTCGSPGQSFVSDWHGWACGQHGGDSSNNPEGVEVISEVEARNIEACAEALKHHPGERLRRSQGHFEVTVIADLCGVRCKGRLDKFIPNPCAILDVKKVAAATSPHRSTGTMDGFDKLIATLGYGFRAAFYTDLVHAVTGQVPRFFWIPVEDGEPFSVGVFEADETVIATGRREYTKFLDDVKKVRSGVECWGFSKTVEKLYGPDWYHKQFGGME